MASILKVDQLQKMDGGVPTAADLGIDVAGSVVQTVTYQHLVTDGSIVTTSDSDVPTGMEVNITPKYANSKIIVSLVGGLTDWTSTASWGVSSVYRSIDGGSNLFLAYLDNVNAAYTAYDSHAGMYVEDVVSTLPTTYKIYMRNRGGAGEYRFYRDLGGVAGSMVLLVQEIAQ